MFKVSTTSSKTIWRSWLILLAIFAIASLAACQTTPPEPQEDSEAEDSEAVSEEAPEEQAAEVAEEEEEADVLVVGVDIADMRTLDPSRQSEFSAPITIHALYDKLVTMHPGNYTEVQPMLATSWELVDDGQAWLFHLRDDVVFSSGNPFTAEDVKFSFDRLYNIKDNLSELAENIEETEIIDENTVKVTMVDKTQPLLNILVAPSFAILDSETVVGQGGLSGPEAETEDTATDWLNANSAGSGPYVLSDWTRNSEVIMTANPNYWGEPPGFERVVLRHISESTAQVLALERGDIDVALNLTPEQLQGLADNEEIRLEQETSLDYMYITLTENPDFNEALASKEARQAVLHSIDYEGLINGLLNGYAVRPAAFIPVGLDNSTVELTEEIGYHEDLDRARELLSDAGYPDGFEFDTYYVDSAIAGTSYKLVAQKVQSDLARVGITMNLNPIDNSTMITKYRGGELTSVFTFWNPDAPEPWLWASASTQRVAGRVHWDVPEELHEIVVQAGDPSDPQAQAEAYREYHEWVVDEAVYQILLQPIYRVAVRNDTVADYAMTAAGWQVELEDVTSAN